MQGAWRAERRRGKEAVLEEHPGGRRMVDRPDKKQGRSTLFETLRWTDNAFAGGPSGTLGNAWLESYYKEGRRKAQPAGERKPEQDLRLVLKDLDGHLSPETMSSQRSSRNSTARTYANSSGITGSDQHEGAGVAAVVPGGGRRHLSGTDVLRGRQGKRILPGLFRLV
ncbi:hypothetical protein N2152v2_001777 [Parachlorella kessleri]